jgi:predicted O-methyltransferase YrrM
VDKYKNISSTIIRGKSNEALHFLKPNTFDLVYIDGSHYYEEVFSDIKNAINLVKNGGIICGDDLDQIPTEENYIIAKSNLEKDLFIFKDGTAIHPGVLAAVKEIFTDNVNWDNGFWWLYINK